MPKKPQIAQFLKRQDRLVWARFLNSSEGQKGMHYLRIAFPTDSAKTDADLIRNGVGFEFWQACVAELESIGDVPDKQERADNDDELEK